MSSPGRTSIQGVAMPYELVWQKVYALKVDDVVEVVFRYAPTSSWINWVGKVSDSADPTADTVENHYANVIFQGESTDGYAFPQDGKNGTLENVDYLAINVIGAPKKMVHFKRKGGCGKNKESEESEDQGEGRNEERSTSESTTAGTTFKIYDVATWGPTLRLGEHGLMLIMSKINNTFKVNESSQKYKIRQVDMMEKWAKIAVWSFERYEDDLEFISLGSSLLQVLRDGLARELGADQKDIDKVYGKLQVEGDPNDKYGKFMSEVLEDKSKEKDKYKSGYKKGKDKQSWGMKCYGCNQYGHRKSECPNFQTWGAGSPAQGSNGGKK